MPLPWYLHNMMKVFSFPLLPIYPFMLSLEAMRGAFLSGTSLALFIDIPSNPSASANRELINLRIFLDRMKDLLEAIPEPLLPMAGPWIDYYHACECFLEVATLLHLQKAGLYPLPESCKECWALQQPGPQSP